MSGIILSAESWEYFPRNGWTPPVVLKRTYIPDTRPMRLLKVEVRLPEG